MQEIAFPVRSVPVTAEFDMVVCGAGLSGIAAAWTAARRGLRVGMAEYFSKPGGVPVSGLLGVISGFRKDEERVVDGLFWQEMLDRCDRLGGVTRRQGWGARVEPEKLSRVLLEMLSESGVTLALLTQLIAAEVEGREVKHVVLASKAGLEAWSARLFVDDTGDGDLGALAGAEFAYGREADGKVQSSSLTFKLGGIDLERVPATMTDASKIWAAHPHAVPTNHTVITYLPGTNGEAAVNMTHILDCHPLTREGQLRIRQEGTAQAFEIAEFFRGHLPGFERCYVAQTAMQPGVREGRRVLGDYVLTAADVIEGRDFADQIARGCWGIDIHNPVAPHGNVMPHFNIRRSYGIPYRCLTPRGFDNLYMAGRAISATHEAHASSRINGSCLAIGEAIGVVSLQALASGDIRRVDVSRLQSELEQQGGIVHFRPCPRD